MGNKAIGGFIFGGIVGAIAGILYAPRSGAETRAILADQIDEYWGQGQDFYEKSVKDMTGKVADFSPAASAKGDELREKIEIARERIASQVAKNAATACDVVDTAVPIATEVVSNVVDKATAAVDAATEAFTAKVEGETGATTVHETEGAEDTAAAPAAE